MKLSRTDEHALRQSGASENQVQRVRAIVDADTRTAFWHGFTVGAAVAAAPALVAWLIR